MVIALIMAPNPGHNDGFLCGKRSFRFAASVDTVLMSVLSEFSQFTIKKLRAKENNGRVSCEVPNWTGGGSGCWFVAQQKTRERSCVAVLRQSEL